jgi:hypothetical protein
VHDRRHRPQILTERLEAGDEVHALDVDAPGELIQRVILVQNVAGRFHILIFSAQTDLASASSASSKERISIRVSSERSASSCLLAFSSCMSVPSSKRDLAEASRDVVFGALCRPRP